jgi:hypothetical protein
MPELRWPDGRGRFVDRDSDRVEDPPQVVQPGETITVDVDVASHYQDRGFDVVSVDEGRDDDSQDGSADADTDGESPDSDTSGDGVDADDNGVDTDTDDDDFDVNGFLDRTPVEDVVDDIEAGQADDHLAAVAKTADRVTVERAVDDRQDALDQDQQ